LVLFFPHKSETHLLPNNHNTLAWAGSYAGSAAIPAKFFNADTLNFSSIPDAYAANKRQYYLLCRGRMTAFVPRCMAADKLPPAFPAQIILRPVRFLNISFYLWLWQSGQWSVFLFTKILINRSIIKYLQ
jgi:hypothetical protein